MKFLCLLVSGIVLAAIVCSVLWYVTEPAYQSKAALQISEKAPVLIFHTGELDSNFAQTQVELLRGPYIVGRAIETEGLGQLPEIREIAGKEDAVPWISQRLNVTHIGQSQLYEITFTARHPESAQKVLAAIVDTYMSFQTGETDIQRQRMLETLKDEVNRLEGEINNKRKNLRDIAEAMGGEEGAIQPPGATPDARLSLLSSLKQKLVSTEIEIEVANARVRSVPNMPDEPTEIPESRVAAALRRDPEILRLKRELNEKRTNLDGANQTDGIRIAEEIAAKVKELESVSDDLKKILTDEAETFVADQRREALSQATDDLKSKQQLATVLRERIEAEREVQAVHGDKSLELQFARDELHNVESVRKQISDRIVQLRTEGRAPSQVTLIQKPKTPEFPEGNIAMKLAIGGTIAFLAPFVACLPCSILAAFRRRAPSSGATMQSGMSAEIVYPSLGFGQGTLAPLLPN